MDRRPEPNTEAKVSRWGGFDGLKKSFDERSFLQRFTPRRPGSVWSQVNQEHAERRTGSGRRAPPGRREVDAARADGRRAAAFAGLDGTNRFAARYRARSPKSDGRRAKAVARLVERLADRWVLRPKR